MTTGDVGSASCSVLTAFAVRHRERSSESLSLLRFFASGEGAESKVRHSRVAVTASDSHGEGSRLTDLLLFVDSDK